MGIAFGCRIALPIIRMTVDEAAYFTPELSSEAGGGGDDALALMCKALGHPIRVAIVKLLLAKRSCICGEIVEELPLAQSTVSQHLKQLKTAGLIRGEVDGPRVAYCVEPAAIARLSVLVRGLEQKAEALNDVMERHTANVSV